MALVATAITALIDTTDATSRTSATISLTANALLIAAVESRIAVGVAGGPVTPTCTGCGVTWVVFETEVTSGASPNRKCTLFRALGTPSAGALTFDFSGETQTHIGHLVLEITDVDTSGTNGSGAIVQTGSANDGGSTGTKATVTLSSFGSVNNMAIGVGLNTGGVTIAPGAGFVELQEVLEIIDGTTFQSEYKLNDPTVDITWTANHSWVMCGFEVKQAVAPSSAKGRNMMTMGIG